jgi:hypothetical protein
MHRTLAFALLIAGSIPVANAQPQELRNGPLISLYLSQGFPSEKVQLRYFLEGPFGGYGSFVQAEAGRQTIDFVAAVDGKAADRIKVIALLPGCELIKLDFPLNGTAMWRRLDCKPLATITLHGRIPAAYIGRESKINVSYQADWAFKFFAIADGMAVVFPLSTVVPDSNGEFSVEVPDFHQQNLGKSSFLIWLGCSDCENLVANGKTDESLPREVPVAGSYPQFIEFTAK